MQRKPFAPALLFCALLQACGTSTPGKPQASAANGAVETRAPNTDYQPAFTGQTRIAGVHTKTAYAGRVLTTALDRPWSLALLPDGRFLVTEKGGNMRIVTAEGAIGAPIAGVPAVNSSGQGGLLGLALDPQFPANRMVYWSFSEARPDGNLTAVAKGRLAEDERSLQNVTVIYRALPAWKSANHYGSRLVFDRNGYLFVSTGERFDRESRPQAQQLNSGLGKIIRITTDGSPAPGNPFLNTAGARPEVYSYGHRNVQSLALHPSTGELWEAEFGPQGGDELNRIVAGKNYGWPVITYGEEYGGGAVGEGITQKTGMEQPVYYWDPVLSPSGMCFYTGDAIPEWKNNIFIAGLNSNHIARLVLDGNRVTGEERILPNEGQRFRDVVNGRDGALYAITDEGRMYRVGRKG